MTEPPVDPTEPTPEDAVPPAPAPDAAAPEPPAPPPQPVPIPVPPPLPAQPTPPQASGSYDEKVLWKTTAWTVGICALTTYLFFFSALLIPLVMLVTLFFISKRNSPRKRAMVAGIILGCGIGLLVSAGVCTAIGNGLPSPFFGGLFGG